MSSWTLLLSAAWLAASLLTGCASRAAEPASTPSPERDFEPVEMAEVADRYWMPPLFFGPQDEAHYYMARLADRRFVAAYGAEEHPRPWYIAAERLGQIGEPALPLLASRLDTSDEYELKLVLYALMLASQDPQVMAATDGDYLELDEVLSTRSNAENRRQAREWWQRQGWRWQ